MNRSMAAMVGAALATFSFSSAHAQSYFVHGPGAQPCSVWLQYRAGGTLALVAPLETWVQGYVSAMNGISAVNGHGPGYPIESGDDGWWRWLDKYCDANPSDSLSTATVALLHALQEGDATSR